AWVYQLPDRLWLAAARGVAAAGFEVQDVDVTGAQEMANLPVYTAALDGASDSMLLVDLDEVKERLELLPWVEEASVGRVLPNRLTIAITERKPAAIWQNDGMHRLVDAEGRILQADDLSRFAHLPLVVDDGADRQVRGLTKLLADYPAFAEHFASATWRGGRRWDVQLKSGETILLPEGGGATRRALDSFVRLERDTQLTGRGFAALDFRVPKQMVVRAGAEGEGEALMTIDGTEI
ncbi:MAG: cell division protein FtsQ/DivIB, partial [Pacificimonas sp.]